MNGEHEVRLARIEASLQVLHDKVDALIEKGAANATDILWLKWGLRLLLTGVLGAGGYAVHVFT